MAASILNKTNVKKRALELGAMRQWKPTRVGQAFIDRFEARAGNLLREMVNEHPSIGKTLL